MLLTGCSQPATSGDVAQQGYQSGDGSTRTWAAADRQGPVTLSGTDYEGATQDVTDWAGDVVVLNTWYANCPPCRAEAPDLAAIADDYADQGVHVLGINHTDAAGTAQAFQTNHGVPYPSIHDEDGSAVAALEGVVPVNAVPTTIVLDRNGMVAGRILGVVDPSTLRSMVDELVAEPVHAEPAATPST
nr:TlpA disulfide reductase family protein [Cellulomonas sp. URHE0023]